MEKFLTLAEAAEILSISTKTLRAHVAAGDLPYLNVGHGAKRKDIRIDPADLRAFIERRKQRDYKSTPQLPSHKNRLTSSCGSPDDGGFLAQRAQRVLKRKAKGNSSNISSVIAFSELPRPTRRKKPGPP